MKHAMAAALVVGALALCSGSSFAAEDSASLEQLIVGMAHTPADHAALAKYYAGKAEDAREEARVHEQMARSYSGGKLAQRQQMESHCKKLSDQNTAAAAEYEALAKLHLEESKKPQ